MEEEFTWAEKRILLKLWPDKRLWYRALAGHEMADRPLRRSLKSLHTRGYIAKDKAPTWKRGMRKEFWLTRKGQVAANRLLVSKAGGELFLQILQKVQEIAEQPDDEGESVTQLGVDIVNMLWDQDKSKKVRDALVEIIKQLK